MRGRVAQECAVQDDYGAEEDERVWCKSLVNKGAAESEVQLTGLGRTNLPCKAIGPRGVQDTGEEAPRPARLGGLGLILLSESASELFRSIEPVALCSVFDHSSLQEMMLFLVWDSEGISETNDTVVEDLLKAADEDSSDDEGKAQKSKKKAKRSSSESKPKKKRKRSSSSSSSGSSESDAKAGLGA